jgi:hypothetical protein
MRAARAGVGCVAVTIVALACAWSGSPLERYLGIAVAGGSDTERPQQAVPDVTARPEPQPPTRLFAGQPGFVVRPTQRADIVIVSTPQPEVEALHRSILAYVAERNPSASMRAFREYPAAVLEEAARTDIDHCLALAQAQVESDFRPHAVGAAGEIGLYQIMPSTAALFEPALGKLRKPVFRRYEYDLGDLADPLISTRFAMAYLRDILARKPTLRGALTEYNGGPRGRQPHYYRLVMATYVEILERVELGCQVRERRAKPRVLELARH